MIANPYAEPMRVMTYPGTRLLKETFDLLGVSFPDPKTPKRTWAIEGFYAPCRQGLGGLRARLKDQKGFVTFLNQRDLEVCLKLAAPTDYCAWAQQDYVAPEDNEWMGCLMDDTDLTDDLHTREMFLRATSPTGILMPGELVRRLHLESGVDVEERLAFLWDVDIETGLTPDARLATLEQRWRRVERTRLQWPRVA